MAETILCPYHNDTNPSMTVYEEYSHCWVCGAHVPNDKVGVKNVPSKKLPENVKESLEYIQALPIRRIRGLGLHADGLGYYIVWPTRKYFKRRHWTGATRYRGPRGVRAPLLIYPGEGDNIVVIEGELNVMTVKECSPNGCTIASPGAASEFMRHIDEYKKYKKITLILDHDPAGISAGIQCKEALLKMSKHVTLVTRIKDYNDVLQQDGPEAVAREFEKDIT